MEFKKLGKDGSVQIGVLKMKFWLFFVMVVFGRSAFATQCGSLDIESIFQSSSSVAIVTGIAVPDVASKSEEDSLELSHAYFVVAYDYKKSLRRGDVIVSIEDYAIPPNFKIGDEYLLFLSEIKDGSEEYIFNDCLTFDLTNKLVYLDSHASEKLFSRYLDLFNKYVNKVILDKTIL